MMNHNTTNSSTSTTVTGPGPGPGPYYGNPRYNIAPDVDVHYTVPGLARLRTRKKIVHQILQSANDIRIRNNSDSNLLPIFAEFWWLTPSYQTQLGGPTRQFFEPYPAGPIYLFPTQLATAIIGWEQNSTSNNDMLLAPIVEGTVTEDSDFGIWMTKALSLRLGAGVRGLSLVQSTGLLTELLESLQTGIDRYSSEISQESSSDTEILSSNAKAFFSNEVSR